MLKDWQCITVNVNAGMLSSMYVCLCVLLQNLSIVIRQAGQRPASSACAVLRVGSPPLLHGREGSAGTLDITPNFV